MRGWATRHVTYKKREKEAVEDYKEDKHRREKGKRIKKNTQ